MAVRKYVTLDTADGEFHERFAVDASDGAADAGEIPELNADGHLDPSILNAATTGSNVVLMTDATGRLDEAVMPVGFGADVNTYEASEPLTAGNLVNVHVVGGAFRVRRADASAGRPAHGFVSEGVATGEMARVYNEGSNGQVAGLTGPTVFLAPTPGGVTSTPPTTSGHIVQAVGVAVSATSFYFSRGRATYLA